ncbi:MAG TPA: cation diffusion facilitator family transporter [Oscillospiraceae bacterium]|nr:cation diffusion facilitator family transporter [Oscillospiraceae bacterium]HRW56217.1 cation diffusion facilitator family transporter [Oscillospiraceae bacterium]
MIRWLAKKLIPNRNDYENPDVRVAYGYLCGNVGIFFNILLFLGKFIAGAVSGSIAVTADAFNNLSDAGSSIITVLGFKLSSRKPDMEHPFGHGRLEYVSGLIVSLLIVMMGVELVKSSVEKIVNPTEAEYSLFTFVILIASILVKSYMYYYNHAIGKKIKSAAMDATALDSFSDAITTFAVLVSSLVGMYTNWMIDGWCGIVVAAFILRTGILAAKGTVDLLVGTPPDPIFVHRIQEIVLSHEGIIGIHDLIVHNYGPGRMMVSLHAEVPCDADIMAAHDTIDNIEKDIREEMHCLAIIHMDPIDTRDELTNETREKVKELVRTIDARLTIHDFRMVSGPTHTNVIFDVVVPFDLKMTDSEVRTQIGQLVGTLGNYFAVVDVDQDVNGASEETET